ncbi:MAG: DUF624 domain-containing protein [Clostridia bacterium]|nr:DUF624 domain-containing protein [Clostridia bacterium]
MGFFRNRMTAPGRGVKKEDVTEAFGLKRFFVTFADKFWKLVVLNLLYFLVNLPLFGIFAYLAGVGGIPYATPTSVVYQPMYGALMHDSHPALLALHGAVGIQTTHNAPDTVTYVLLGLGLLVLFTFGMGNAALTYVQRNFVRREPVDLAPDFFLCIKKNFRQAMALGLLDLLFVFVIAFDLTNYLYGGQTFGTLVMFYASLFISLLYLMMRPYLYLLSVTFDLKLGRLIKNAWILTVAGIGRNLLCGVMAALVFVLNAVVFAFIPSLGVGMLFIFTVSFAWFFQIYGAWPVVKKHMIDPFYEEKTVSPDEEEEAVFTDRG